MNNPVYPDLRGKVAVVTGGSRGIGAATCRLLAANGANVVVSGRNRAAINQVVESIQKSGGNSTGMAAECTSASALEALRTHAEQEFGPVAILAAFAGGGGEPVPFEELSEQQWHATIDDNLTATFLTVRCFLPGMIKRGNGAIVTMASRAGRIAGGASIAYAAAKAGVVMFSAHLARTIGQHGVRLNCLAPSFILTERAQRVMPDAEQLHLAAQFPLQRLGTPEDVERAALFLLSESGGWITGTTLDMSGGRT